MAVSCHPRPRSCRWRLAEAARTCCRPAPSVIAFALTDQSPNSPTYGQTLSPADTWILTYCGCPHTLSGQAAADLMALGFAEVAALDEGYFAWQDAGYPIVTGPSSW